MARCPQSLKSQTFRQRYGDPLSNDLNHATGRRAHDTPFSFAPISRFAEAETVVAHSAMGSGTQSAFEMQTPCVMIRFVPRASTRRVNRIGSCFRVGSHFYRLVSRTNGRPWKSSNIRVKPL